MKTKIKTRKRRGAGAFSIAVLLSIGAGFIFFHTPKNTLIELQKRYVLATTIDAKEQVIEELQGYYLSMEIPDSIDQKIEISAQHDIKSTIIDTTGLKYDIYENLNPYELEVRLESLLHKSMIAKARSNDGLFASLVEHVLVIAKRVDDGTGNPYWVEFINRMRAYTPEQALNWLKIKKAQQFYRKRHDQPLTFAVGEQFGAAGLKYLKDLDDPRARLDILQRLQVALLLCRGLNDLSIGLAEQTFKEAGQIGYILRASGILFHKAEALSRNGQIIEAIQIFQMNDRYADEYNMVPSMAWYKKNGLVQVALCHQELGNSREALAVCDALDKLPLSKIDQIQVNNIRGITHESLGNFEISKVMYRNALDLAESSEDRQNEITCLFNLGLLFYKLADYDLSLRYLNLAQEKYSQYRTAKPEVRRRIMLKISDIMVKKNRVAEADSLFTEAIRNTAKSGTSPRKKSDMLTRLAKYNFDSGRIEDAMNNLAEAELACQRNGLFHQEIWISIKTARYYIEAGRIPEALQKVKAALQKAKDCQYPALQIESYDVLAQIELKRGNLEGARAWSNKLALTVKSVTTQHWGTDLFYPVKQKNHKYLKRGIILEIQAGNFEHAFVKLSQAKDNFSLGDPINASQSSMNANSIIAGIKDYLGPRTVLLDYLVAPDSVYVFALDHKNGLQLFRKSLKRDAITQSIQGYRSLISKTALLLEKYDSDELKTHFNRTIQNNQQLYDNILDWIFAKQEYREITRLHIIPDGELFDLPFSTLTKSQMGKNKFLAQQVSTSYSQSSLDLLSLNGNNSDLLDFKNQNILLCVDDQIPGAREFGHFVKNQFPNVEILTVPGNKAVRLEIQERLHKPIDNLIILGHGESNTAFPGRSFIEMAAFNESSYKTEKVKFRLKDLQEIGKLNINMVLLVGCETGDGKIYSGSGIAGLQQGFLSMGATHVLGTLWKVNAEQTLSQMKSFLKNLSIRSSPEIALNQTLKLTLQSLDQHPVYRQPHPYLWGSYTLYSRSAL